MRGIGARFVYILRSDSDRSRHYVGRTSNVAERLEWHNAGPSGFTMRHRPWRVIVSGASLIPLLRREVQAFGPDFRVSALEPIRTLMAQTISNDRTVAQLAGLFGALAVLLAVAGLYGVTSYTMSRRTSEVGLRMVLGADRASVIRMVLREALMLIAAGLALGLPTALVSSRLTAASLSDVSPHDPLIVAAALLVMLVAGLCAGVVPAIRASRIDPVKALQQDALRSKARPGRLTLPTSRMLRIGVLAPRKYDASVDLRRVRTGPHRRCVVILISNNSDSGALRRPPRPVSRRATSAPPSRAFRSRRRIEFVAAQERRRR